MPTKYKSKNTAKNMVFIGYLTLFLNTHDYFSISMDLLYH